MFDQRPGPSLPHLMLIALAVGGLALLLWRTNAEPLAVSRWGGAGGVFSAPPVAAIRGEAAAGGLEAAPNGDAERPYGNPLGDPRTVLTQGYGVGSHAPAAIWGGLDLAIDGTGDGMPEPGPTQDAPIYATHNGVARVRPDTWPAGNYLAIENDRYKTAFAHLSRYAVANGEAVTRGQIIGYVGSTGQSSGPHLHYEVWEDGSNRNPQDFGAPQ